VQGGIEGACRAPLRLVARFDDAFRRVNAGHRLAKAGVCSVDGVIRRERCTQASNAQVCGVDVLAPAAN